MPEGYFRDTILINGILYVLGNGFIRLMQMLVVPLVFCSLVCGAMAIGDTKTLGTVGVKTILFYLCTTALAMRGTGHCQSDQSRRRFKYCVAGGCHRSRDHPGRFCGDVVKYYSEKYFLPLCPPEICCRSSSLLYLSVFFYGCMGNRVSTVANFFSQFNDIMMEMTIAVMKAALSVSSA